MNEEAFEAVAAVQDRMLSDVPELLEAGHRIDDFAEDSLRRLFGFTFRFPRRLRSMP